MNSRYKVYGLEWVNAPSGSIIYFDNDGIGYLLPIPSDWLTQETAGTPYVLGIAAGLPAWRIGTTSTVGTGYGNNYGNDYGGPV